MRRLIIVAALLAIAPAALAQQQTPMEQALASKLLTEINAGLACLAGETVAHAELAKAQARIKELEDKEPKK